MEPHEKPVPKVLTLGICPGVEGKVIYPFDDVFKNSTFLYGPDDVHKVDAVVLWGGTDIGSSYYNEKPHPLNQQQNAEGSQRDQFEWSIIKAARGLGKPILGVCRGAQFLCAAAGGKLVQHMPKKHSGGHQIYVSGQLMYAVCDHHQAMIVKDVPDAAVLAWAEDTTPEVVYFPSLKALAIQPHPEWQSESAQFVQWCVDKVKQLMDNSLENKA